MHESLYKEICCNVTYIIIIINLINGLSFHENSYEFRWSVVVIYVVNCSQYIRIIDPNRTIPILIMNSRSFNFNQIVLNLLPRCSHWFVTAQNLGHMCMQFFPYHLMSYWPFFLINIIYSFHFLFDGQHIHESWCISYKEKKKEAMTEVSHDQLNVRDNNIAYHITKKEMVL
jgi:hypothetical protein